MCQKTMFGFFLHSSDPIAHLYYSKFQNLLKKIDSVLMHKDEHLCHIQLKKNEFSICPKTKYKRIFNEVSRLDHFLLREFYLFKVCSSCSAFTYVVEKNVIFLVIRNKTPTFSYIGTQNQVENIMMMLKHKICFFFKNRIDN